MNMPTAVITGITGQDGSYLAEFLLEKSYVVHGIVRRSSSTQRFRLDGLFRNPEIYDKRLFLHYADLDDITTIRRILMKVAPDELYHLAGQSHVGASFDIPETTCQFTAMGTLKLLEILRDLPQSPKFLHASSSEIFGNPATGPQSEDYPMRPVSPYGIAKAFATQMVSLYRKSFNLFACNAICYNHESPRRGESFVTRKITKGVASILAGKQQELKLGDIQSRRDWGYAPEYVEAMWKMLQQASPDDYLLATGITHSVKDFLELAFKHVGLDWENYVTFDKRFSRPTSNNTLVGDASKSHSILGWKPKTTLQEIVGIMVNSDIATVSNG